MKAINKNILFVLPTPKQPRFHKRIFEYKKENKITLFYYSRDNYNTLNSIPEVNSSINLGVVENGKYFNRIKKLYKLFKLIKIQRNQSEVIYCFGLDLLFVTVLARKKTNEVWFEIGDIRVFKNKYLEKCFTFIYKKFIFKHVDFISVTSNGFKNYLLDKFSIPSNKIFVKANFLLRNDFLKVSCEVKEFPEQFIVGIVGFLRYDTILSFLKEYKKREDNKFIIHIYGQGPIIDEILNIIQNTNIKYFGEFKYPVDLERIYKKIHFSYVLYDNSDLNVRLALPNKLYESIFFKTPILVSENTFLCEKTSLEFNIGKCFDPMKQNLLIDFLNDVRIKELYKEFLNNMSSIPQHKYIK